MKEFEKLYTVSIQIPIEPINVIDCFEPVETFPINREVYLNDVRIDRLTELMYLDFCDLDMIDYIGFVINSYLTDYKE